jgi:hypothetical protein
VTRLPYHLLVLSTLLLPLGPAAAQQFGIGFDNVGAPGAFSQIFPGLANGPHVVYPAGVLDGGVILNDALFSSGATSGNNILATCDTCLLGDGPPATGLPGFITGTLTTSVRVLSLDIINGSTAGGGLFTLKAFDATGSVVATDSVFAGTLGSGTFVQSLGVTGSAIKSFTVTADLPGGYTFAIDTVTGLPLEGDWTDLGFALGGTNGLPQLAGVGSLSGGDPVTLSLSSALGSTTAALVAGFSQVNAPFEGGVFVPSPDVIRLFPTSPAGQLEGTASWPVGVPAGADVFFQFWIFDAGGPFGFAASNGLRATTP